MQHIKNKEEFEQLITDNKNVVIDFYAEWCGPCKMLSPVIEEVALEKSNVVFVKVNVDEAQELAALFGVSSIPTVAYIKDKSLALRELGFKPKDKILSNLTTVFGE